MWKKLNKKNNFKTNSKLWESTNSVFIFHNYFPPHNFPLYHLPHCSFVINKSWSCEWREVWNCGGKCDCRNAYQFIQLLNRNWRCKAHRHGLAPIKHDLEMSNTLTMSTDKHISRLDGNPEFLLYICLILRHLDALQRRYHYFSARKTLVKRPAVVESITVWNHNYPLTKSIKSIIIILLRSSGLCCLQCFLSTLVFSRRVHYCRGDVLDCRSVR